MIARTLSEALKWDVCLLWQFLLTQYLVCTGYPSKSEKLWSMEKMKTYFCLIRSLHPTLSEAGNQVLLRYYQMQRQSDSRNAARTTIRLLESLIRLAEGLFHSTNEFGGGTQYVQGMGVGTMNSKMNKNNLYPKVLTVAYSSKSSELWNLHSGDTYGCWVKCSVIKKEEPLWYLRTSYNLRCHLFRKS